MLFRDSVPGGTPGVGTPFKNEDFTSISFFGEKDQGKRTLIRELANQFDVDIPDSDYDKRNIPICKFHMNVDGTEEAVQIMLTERFPTEEEKKRRHDRRPCSHRLFRLLLGHQQ